MRIGYIVAAVAAFVVLVLGGIAVFLASVDLERYRALAEEALTAAAGRSVTIGGDIGIAFSLRPAIMARDVHLANTHWGQAPKLVRIGEATVQFRLLPLMRGDLVIDSIAIEDVAVHLETDAAGRRNWDLDAGAEDTRPPLPDVIAVRGLAVTYRGGAGAAAPRLQLRLVTIAIGDGAAPIGIEAEALVHAQAFEIIAKIPSATDLIANRAGVVNARIESPAFRLTAAGRLGAPLDLGDFDIALSAEGADAARLARLAGFELSPGLGFAAVAQLAGSVEAMELTGLRARIGSSDVSGSIGADWRGTRLRVQFDLASRLIDAEQLLSSATPAEAILFWPLDRVLPTGLMERADGDLRFRADRVQVPGTAIEDVSLGANIDAGALRIEIEKAAIAGAVIGGTVSRTGEGDSWSLALSVAALDPAVLGVPRDWPGLIVPAFDAELSLSASGTTPEALLRSLAGTVLLTARPTAESAPGAVRLVPGRLGLEIAAAGGDILFESEGALFEGEGALPGLPLRLSGRTGGVAAPLDTAGAIPLEAILEVPGTTLRLHGALGGAQLEGAAFAFDLQSDDPAPVIALAGFNAPAPVAAPVTAVGRIRFGDSSVFLTGAAVEYGSTDLAGDVDFTWGGARPRFGAAIESDVLDLDAIMDVAGSAVGGGNAPDGAAWPIETLAREVAAFDGELRLRAERVRAAGREARAIEFEMSLNRGRLDIPAFAGVIEGIAIAGRGRIESADTIPALSVSLETVNADFTPVLRLLGVPDSLTLSGRARAQLSFQGREAAELLASVRGTVEVHDGRLGWADGHGLEAAISEMSAEMTPLALRIEGRGQFRGEGLETSLRLPSLAAWATGLPFPISGSFRLGNVTGEGSGSLAAFPESGAFGGSFHVEGPDLAAAAALAGTTVPVAQPFSVSAGVSRQDMRIQFSGVDARLGGSDLSGTIVIERGGDLPRIDATVASRVLDLDSLFPGLAPNGDDDDGEGAEAEPGPRVFPETPLPLALWWQAEGTIEAGIAAMRLRGTDIVGLSLAASLKTGVLDIGKLDLRVGDGAIGVAGALAARDPELVLRLEFAGERLDSAGLLRIVGAKPYLEAPMELAAKLDGRGATARALAASLNGNVRGVVGAGTLHETDYLLFEGGLLRQVAPFISNLDSASINCAVADWTVEGGVASTEALLLDTQRMSLLGRGSLDLGKETFDMILTPRPKELRLLDLAVPVHLGGTFRDPTIEPTPAGLGKKVLTTLGALVNPLVLLVPVIEAVTAERNPCVAAMAGDPAQESETQGGAVGDVIRGIGRTIDRALGNP